MKPFILILFVFIIGCQEVPSKNDSKENAIIGEWYEIGAWNPKVNRKPLPAITLAQDPSTITAVSNDYDFKYLFSRNLRALAKKNDVLIAISTSGNSKNIIEVLKEAKKLKIKSIALLGCGGGIAKKFTDYPIVVESNNTASIQETHIFLGHFIFENVEDIILNRNISS